MADTFFDAVSECLPEHIGGTYPHSVSYVPTTQGAQIVAVYFLKQFGDEWRQFAIHVSASEREIEGEDIPALARRKVDEAFDRAKLASIAPDFFAAAA
jgi:hypothetical protein